MKISNPIESHDALSDVSAADHHAVYLDAEAVAAVEAVATLTIQGQLGFPATQSPSGAANVLDDYEIGAWTPDLEFGNLKVGITYSDQQGQYTKIGRLVAWNCRFTLTSKGSSTGNADIKGLPFTVAGADGGGALSFTDVLSFADMIIVRATGTELDLHELSNAGAITTLLDTNFSDTTHFQASGVYRV